MVAVVIRQPHLKDSPQQMFMLSRKLPDVLFRDFVSCLPPEVVTIILRYLDGEQLLLCCLVSKSWNERISNLMPVWDRVAKNCGVRVPIIDSVLGEQNPDGVEELPRLTAPVCKALFCHAKQILKGFNEGSTICIEEEFIDKGAWRVTSVRYHRGNVVTGCDDHTVQVWSVPEGRVLSTVSTHSVCCLTITDNHLYTASFNANAECWDLTTGFHSRTFCGHTSAVLAIDVTDDEHFLLTGSVDKTAKLWDLTKSDTEQLIVTFDDAHDDWVFQVKFLPKESDDLQFITCDSNVCCLWRTNADGRVLSSNHVTADNTAKFTSFYHMLENPRHVYACQWTEANKSSALCEYEVVPKVTKIQKVMSFMINLDNIKAFLLGAGSRFAVIMCSISRKDFHILDIPKQTVVATIATPDFYVLTRNGSTVTLCDTSWLNGFQFSKMKADTPVFAAGIALNKVMLGTWAKFVSKFYLC
ncbi:F-box/WD repeat-containing protein 2 isoform X2 [Aplysia californica]|uniref:F-box/WD repeat-containing protein 2 isoform X2 n=1 Tax=Aplysia californica TaxID=6500 RepID=A0ABM1VQN6_APLCA|nr:F-box/WD repeat-containing protein 2 isoform X2 [Aplysia californica]